MLPGIRRIGLMATVIQHVDDLDDTIRTNVKTMQFSVEGAHYEIDLGLKSQDKLRQALAPFVRVARAVPATPAKTGAKRQRSNENLAVIRSWARKNGWPGIANRGRIPADAVKAYKEAHDAA